MNSWARYVVAFFALVVVLSALLIAFGPREYRAALWSSETPVGQLPADSQMENPGQMGTTSGTSQAPGAASEER